MSSGAVTFTVSRQAGYAAVGTSAVWPCGGYGLIKLPMSRILIMIPGAEEKEENKEGMRVQEAKMQSHHCKEKAAIDEVMCFDCENVVRHGWRFGVVRDPDP